MIRNIHSLTILAAVLLMFSAAAEAAPQTTAPAKSPEAVVQTQPAPLFYKNAGQLYSDLVYANQSSSQKLDLYLPSHAGKPYPVILAIHGDAWQGSNKSSGDINPQIAGLKYGFAIASINYRSKEEAVFPAALQDAKTAVRFLRSQAKKYKLDSHKIIAWGDSYGSNLAALLAVTGKEKNFENKQQAYKKYSSRVEAAVVFYPTVAVSQAESPLSYKANDLPPFVLIHGTRDAVVPAAKTQELAAALKARLGEKDVYLHLIEGAGHGGPAFSSESTLEPIFAFLHKKADTPKEVIKTRRK